MDGVLMQKLCDLLQIAKTMKWSNRKVQSSSVTNHTLLFKEQSDWDLNLQQIAGAIRSIENTQTKFTQNFMMLGREVTRPIYLTLVQQI